MISSAFTCTGPYAILIMLGIKRVENRAVLPSPCEGRCAVGCSKSFCQGEYGNFVQWASRALPPEDFALIPAWNDVKEWPGTIVGVCDYEASAERPFALTSGAVSALEWNEGYQYWWKLSNVVCFDQPIPCRGNVGMWQMPPELAAQVSAADALVQCGGTKVATPESAARLFRKALSIAGQNEGVFVLPVDAECRALSEPALVSLGDPVTMVVQPREVFAVALKQGAASVILAHNHPSGDLTPSLQDRQLTAVLRNMGAALGVPVLDHLVISSRRDGWSSAT